MTLFDLIGFGLLAVIAAVLLFKRAPSRGVWILAMLPVMNVMVDLTNYVPTAIVRPILVPLRIGVLGAVCLYCLFTTPRHSPVTRAILVFLLYLAFLLPLSSNPLQSASVWLRHFVLMLMFAAGYRWVRDVDRLRVLNIGLLASMGLLLLNFVLAQLFGFGRSPYRSEAAVYLGGGGIHLINNFVYFILLVPLLLVLSRRQAGRYVVYAAAVLSGVAVLMVMKRISIVALGAGILVYLLLAPQKERRVLVLLATLGLLSTFSPLYIDTIVARSNRLVETSLEGDKQSKDWNWWYEDWVMTDYSTRMLLVGKEIFLSSDYFGGGRKIHTDYIALLHGAGAIGLLLYMLVFAVLLMCHGIRGSPLNGLTFARELRAVSCSLVVACFVVGWSSGMAAITPRGLIFLYVGAIAGVLHQRKLWESPARRSPNSAQWRDGSMLPLGIPAGAATTMHGQLKPVTALTTT